MFEEMGIQVIVEPFHEGKAIFGYSKRVSSGNPSVPSAVGTTWIRFRDQSELDHIRRHSAQIIQDFLEEAGFISIVTGASKDRAFTVTAWETEDAIHRALDRAHSSAKHDFRTSDLSHGVRTSVWKPHHINRSWTRCPSCNQQMMSAIIVALAAIVAELYRNIPRFGNCPYRKPDLGKT